MDFGLGIIDGIMPGSRDITMLLELTRGQSETGFFTEFAGCDAEFL